MNNLSEEELFLMRHIRSAVSHHQNLQAKNGNAKTLRLDLFILMQNTGLWNIGISLNEIYPTLDKWSEEKIDNHAGHSKQMDGHEFNLHRHWKDDTEQDDDDHGGTIKHFNDSQ